MFCYAQDVFGGGTDLSNVKSTQMVVNTLCCRSISYINFPTSVIGDNKVYSPKDTLKFLFSYKLSSTPDNSLTVTPSFVKVGYGNSDYESTVLVKPLSVTFSNNSLDASSLIGSFVLSTEDSGLFEVRMILTGSDKNIYTSSTKLLQILDVNDPPLPPILTTVKFLDNGAGLFVTFDSSTDRGKTVLTSSFWTCSAILIFNDDQGSTCSWISDTTVKVIFGRDAVTKVGDKITWKQNRIKALCNKNICNGYVYSNQNITLSIQLPDNPISPVINSKIPSIVSACEDVIVDVSSSYGNGGRPWKSISMSLSATYNFVVIDSEDITLINDLFKDIVTIAQPFVIPVLNLNSSWNFMVTFTLVNFLDATTTASKSFVRSSQGDIPSVKFSGSSDITITTSSTLMLLSQGKASPCVGNSKKLTFSW